MARPIIHIEIPAKDREASARFYSELFEWETRDLPQMDYTSVQSGNIAGGLFQSSEKQPGVVSFYVESDDIDGDLKKVEQLGGKVLAQKTHIPSIGWFAFFTDPHGNVVGLGKFSPAQEGIRDALEGLEE
jgi:uncharacterized protein